MGNRLIPADPAGLKSNNFDAIRLAMALLVVWSHSWAVVPGGEYNEPISRITGHLYNAGNIGVLVFFVISGFLICHSYLRSKTLGSYFSRRVRRIHPGYMVVTLICALVVTPLFSSRSFGDLTPVEFAKTIGANLLLHNYAPPSNVFENHPINGSLWSIPFEFWCYIGLAAIGSAGLLSRRLLCVLALAAVMGVRLWLDATGREIRIGSVGHFIGWPALWLTVLPCFLAGVVVYLYRDILPRSRAALAIGIAILLACAHAPIADAYRHALSNAVFPPVVAYATFHAAFSPTIRLPHAARFGDFSYGTYLYAFPIRQMLVFGFAPMPFPVLVVTTMVLSLAAGVASWNLVERWFLSPARRQREKKESRQPLPAQGLEEQERLVAP